MCHGQVGVSALPAAGPFPGLWALPSGRGAIATSLPLSGNYTFFYFFFLLFFLSPTIEAVVFRYQVDKTLRKAQLTSIYAFFGGQSCLKKELL